MSRDGTETRKAILDASWALLESGDRAVRMSDIARAAGISRQALYLHFPNRADLLSAVTLHIDASKNVDARLAASRAATSGEARLEAFIEAWGNYIPEIHGVAKALIAMQDSDEEARRAWQGRLAAVRAGCEAAVAAIVADGRLAPDLTTERAGDLLAALLSVETWERLTRDCGWPQADYVATMKALARKALIGG
ncbi:DNA-binding transcriptional repressor AcrR [Hartmannibacter diazotrophicus]|uniref:DNA-binding transcriptional repressor AcrR n=1 Tax=Hartmannibacter diazotrophicus TaxID=1482074 RepID=A0A2C9DAH6_9HYPH|nr:TetR/AcrR family transcriptional regulator [Hartmannibacter diazotrophicus]SON57160.1 DNA-binding transcriptional repressor AcrR [Hartmannibacter diazotrophicus]